jgi:fatty-acyl-CoA synthase
MARKAVFEAAVVAVPYPKWQERPVACVKKVLAKKKTFCFRSAMD